MYKTTYNLSCAASLSCSPLRSGDDSVSSFFPPLLLQNPEMGDSTHMTWLESDVSHQVLGLGAWLKLIFIHPVSVSKSILFQKFWKTPNWFTLELHDLKKNLVCLRGVYIASKRLSDMYLDSWAEEWFKDGLHSLQSKFYSRSKSGFFCLFVSPPTFSNLHLQDRFPFVLFLNEELAHSYVQLPTHKYAEATSWSKYRGTWMSWLWFHDPYCWSIQFQFSSLYCHPYIWLIPTSAKNHIISSLQRRWSESFSGPCRVVMLFKK